MGWRLLAVAGFGLLAVILITVGRPYLLRFDEVSEGQALTGSVKHLQASPTPADTPAPGVPEQAQAASPPAQPAFKPGERARAMIEAARSGGTVPDLNALFRQAEQFKAAGALSDAHLLYFFAAREGHIAAARELAAMYDPVNFAPERSLMDEPIPTRAYKWYRAAADGGDAEAERRLEALRAWAERAATDGDAEAARLLMRWQ